MYQRRIGFAPGTGAKAIEPVRTDSNAHQAQRRETHGRGHAPYLAVAAFADNDFDPGGRNIFAEADGRVARPQDGLGQHARLGRARALAVQYDSTAQFPQRRIVRHAFYLHPVGLGQLVQRVGDALLQPAVIGEQQQALAVVVESSGRVHARYGNKFSKRAPTCLVGELA